MSSSPTADTLEKELNWFGRVLETRFKLYFQEPCEVARIEEVTPPEFEETDSMYARTVLHYKMGMAERLTLLLALIPHVRPHLLDPFFTKNAAYDRIFTEFGGVKGTHFSGFLPTGQTVAFLLTGNDLAPQFDLLYLFSEAHYFFQHNILKLESDKENEPILAGRLTLSKEYINYFTTGGQYFPKFSTQFPASRLETRLEWDDLVLEPVTLEEIDEIKAWIKHGHSLMNDWGLERTMKRGYRSLFYGPPGTGKTLTASLLGKMANMPVFRIDLSMVVSKYIGETEKNLGSIFDQAEYKNWILFFDEADALFGKRTQVKDSKDRYANQEVSYLLQRIEDFPGISILATNLKNNLDDAFIRRFQSVVYFPMPGVDAREELWRKSIPPAFRISSEVDFRQLAQAHEMAGGAIINVARYSCLMAVNRGSDTITLADIQLGIRKEFRKEGKTVGF